MLTEFDTSLPSIKQVQRLIKENTSVELKLITGDMIAGTVLWQDSQCFCVMEKDNQKTTVWKQAIAYLREL
ncbi:MAG: RNA-binding protein hfq [Rivularia sp. T60_A2020_040]|nr:RNA-binding protein hfq [Rivularia sp. T60_A2020_040]